MCWGRPLYRDTAVLWCEGSVFSTMLASKEGWLDVSLPLGPWSSSHLLIFFLPSFKRIVHKTRETALMSRDKYSDQLEHTTLLTQFSPSF